MSQSRAILALTWPAGADLSGSRGCAVKLDAGTVIIAEDDEFGIGVLDNAPTEGQPARVVLLGTAKVRAESSFSVGDALSIGDDDGKFDTTGAAEHVMAIAIEAAGAEDDLVEALLVHYFSKAA